MLQVDVTNGRLLRITCMRTLFWLSLVLTLTIAAPAVAQTLTLSQFLESVQTQNPDLQIEKHLNEEAVSRAQGIRIPPPMVGIMNMRDGAGTNQGIEVSQQMPFPTKISKEKEVRNLEAEAQRITQSFRNYEILSHARTAFFEFWSAFEKNQITKEKRDWLKKHSKLARASTRADSTAQVHLLGIESDVDMLENEVLESDSSLVEKRNALKTFAPAVNFDQLQPEVPKVTLLKIDPQTKKSKVSLKEAELSMTEAGKSLKNQSYLPDLFIRYRRYNGNDTAPRSEETMVGITLPFLFFWQPQAEKSEASARSQRAAAELSKAQIEAESKFKNLSVKIESLNKQLTALEDTLIPRAHKRMKLVDNLSTRTMEGLEEHRNVMIGYLDLRQKSVEVRMELEKSLSELMTEVGQGVTK
jgi:outer membrane protein TolC